MALRYDRKEADRFGRDCLGVTGPVPIEWQRVRADLSTMIGADHPLTSLRPADVADFCPGYDQASAEQRAGFWRELAYEVIKPEAGSNAHSLMWEQPRDKQGNPIPGAGEYSVGLLQLSISNAKPYHCDITDEASLLDPTRNLACGVRIIARLAARDGRIGGDLAHGRLGLGSYWSTIRVVARKPGGSGRETRAPIIEAVGRLPQCAG